MKTRKKLLIIMVFISLLLSTKTFSQEATTHYIILSINTATIDSHNQSTAASFGQDEDISNEEYTISAQVGDTIIWKGKSISSEDDEVIISSINWQGGTNVFGPNTLKDTQDYPGQVTGIIANGIAGDEMKYTVSFKVLNNGVKRGGTYHIDPKIQINK